MDHLTDGTTYCILIVKRFFLLTLNSVLLSRSYTSNKLLNYMFLNFNFTLLEKVKHVLGFMLETISGTIPYIIIQKNLHMFALCLVTVIFSETCLTSTKRDIFEKWFSSAAKDKKLVVLNIRSVFSNCLYAIPTMTFPFWILSSVLK